MKRFLSCITVILLAATILSGCSAASPSASSPSYSPGEISESMNYRAAEDGAAAPLPLLTPSNAGGRQMVYTVDLKLQTTAFPEGTRRLLNEVEKTGGYVQSARIEGHNLYYQDGDRYAKYTVRIPSEKLAAFLVTMEDNYNLWLLTQESEDITGQHRYTESRLPDLKEQEARLLAALEDEKDTEERLMLERKLTDVQVQISDLSASMEEMDYDVTYSTVSIELFEVNLDPIEEIPEDPFGVKLSKAIHSSFNGFVAFCQGTLLFLIAALPAVVVLGVLGGIVLLALRFWKKRNGKFTGAIAGRPNEQAAGNNGDITPPQNN